MKRPAALCPIVLALGAIILAPLFGAQAQSGREEGPMEIEKCQTIDKPGSYKLVNNLSATGDCLVITADFVTIDLSGFLISGGTGGVGISSPIKGPPVTGTAVRNGSISGFFTGVSISGIVEGLRVSGASSTGIGAGQGSIVKGNIASGNGFAGISGAALVIGNAAANNSGAGIFLDGLGGTAIDNNAIGNGGAGIAALAFSTVIGNTASINGGVGIGVDCPSNVTNNTAVDNDKGNLALSGTGCNNTNNVAP